MNLKCHWCAKELELTRPDYNDPPNLKHYECPDIHLSINMYDDKIESYILFWFEEDIGIKNKLISNQKETFLYIAKRGSAHGAGYKGYKLGLSIPQHISLVIEDNQVQYKNVITRLRKLVAFS